MKNEKQSFRRCECGDWSGVRCEGKIYGKIITVEYFPEHLRASHVAANNRGAYPFNGAVRMRVSEECAKLMLESDPDWTEIVNLSA